MTRLKQGRLQVLQSDSYVCTPWKKNICSASVGFDPITLTVCRHDTWYRRYVLRIDSTSRTTSIQYTLDIDSSNLSTYCIDNYSALVGEFRQMYITYTNWVIHSTPLFWPHIKLCPKPSGRTAQLNSARKAIPLPALDLHAGWKKQRN